MTIKKDSKLIVSTADGAFAPSGLLLCRGQHYTLRPFRFYDLPAELRTLILEEFARDTYIDCRPLSLSGNAKALLKTCKTMMRDFTPILFEHAQIRLRVDNWDFGAFQNLFSVLKKLPPAKKAISRNKSNHSIFTVRRWRFDEDEEKLFLWLAVCQAYPNMDFTYEAYIPPEFRGAESAAKFLWTAGAGEIRGLAARLKEDENAGFKRTQLHRIVGALDLQAEKTETAEATEKMQRESLRPLLVMLTALRPLPRLFLMHTRSGKG